MAADAARLFVREVGAGDPIVVIHGGPDFDHEYLLPEMDMLADHFRVVYYDQRGRGQSFSGERADNITLASELADLDLVREWTGAASVPVVGHSWGGLLALEYAVRQPDRVSQLVLISPAPVSNADLGLVRRSIADRRSPADVAALAALKADPAYENGEKSADAAYHRIHFRTGVRDPKKVEHIVARLRRSFTPAGIVAARAIEDALYERTWLREDYDLIPSLADIRAPTLVLHGDVDLIPVEIAEHIASAIPGARLVVVPNCGHFAFVEQPDRTMDELVQFLTMPSLTS